MILLGPVLYVKELSVTRGLIGGWDNQIGIICKFTQRVSRDGAMHSTRKREFFQRRKEAVDIWELRAFFRTISLRVVDTCHHVTWGIHLCPPLATRLMLMLSIIINNVNNKVISYQTSNCGSMWRYACNRPGAVRRRLHGKPS